MLSVTAEAEFYSKVKQMCLLIRIIFCHDNDFCNEFFPKKWLSQRNKFFLAVEYFKRKLK